MEDKPQVLDFVKAVSDADRLRIIGVLSQQPASIRDVASRLNMSFRDAFAHLGLLEFAGVVHKDGELFRLDEAAVQALSRQQFSAPQRAASSLPRIQDKASKVLETFLKTDVARRQLPAQAAKRQVVLEHVVKAFQPGTDYSEKEVNDILHAFYPDSASLRRYLVDAGLLSRESNGSRYWRQTAERR